jgi:hypothetical protein
VGLDGPPVASILGMGLPARVRPAGRLQTGGPTGTTGRSAIALATPAAEAYQATSAVRLSQNAP